MNFLLYFWQLLFCNDGIVMILSTNGMQPAERIHAKEYTL
jgi:hypothetical protein